MERYFIMGLLKLLLGSAGRESAWLVGALLFPFIVHREFKMQEELGSVLGSTSSCFATERWHRQVTAYLSCFSSVVCVSSFVMCGSFLHRFDSSLAAEGHPVRAEEKCCVMWAWRCAASTHCSAAFPLLQGKAGGKEPQP